MFKKEEQKQEKNRGITLIALVITIIVMLILVAVTITMAINGGLFENTGKAVSDTQNELDKEQQIANGKIQIDGVWYDSIDDYINGNPTAVHNWTRNGDTFTCSHCNLTCNMGEGVRYTPAGKQSTILTSQMSGYDKNQTIEVQIPDHWIVLGIEDTNKDGINETLLITTYDPVNEGIYFYGAEAYNNGPSEINRICEELYSNSEYGKARGMTIEDINNALNDPLKAMQLGGMYYENSTWKTTGNLITKLRDLPIWNSIKTHGTYTPDGANTEEALGEYELNGYMYGVNDDGTALINPVNGETHNITAVESDVIFGNSYDYLYWLASRGVNADSGSSYFGSGFGPGGVGNGMACSHNSDIFCSDGYEYDINAGLRPVVSLKYEIPEIGDPS